MIVQSGGSQKKIDVMGYVFDRPRTARLEIWSLII